MRKVKMMHLDYPKERPAFTVIELIFVIIIIGILAAIALGSLSATRDDAKLSADASNMNICIKDAYGKYLATHTDLVAGDSTACDAVVCYDINYSVNGINFVVTTNPTAANYCNEIEAVGGNLAGTYQFGGEGVRR